jgi:hypothetical protein
MTGSGDERLVESGGFRVDARRAVEVLRGRQLRASFWRPALWVRCAAACGASRLRFYRRGGTLTVAFDGKPLPRALLAQPFGRLVEGEADPVARWFGWALLHTAVPGVKVAVASGAGARRAAAVCDHEGGVVAADPDAERGTVVTARWNPVGLHGELHPAAWFLGASGEHGVVLPKGVEGAPFPIEYGVLSQTPWASASSVLASPGGAAVRLYLLGTLVHDGPLPDFPLPLAVSLRDDALATDASLGAVVRDGAFAAACQRARTLGTRFALEAVRAHARPFRLAARLLAEREDLRLGWVEALGVVRGDEPLFSGLKRLFSDPRRSGDRLRVLRAAESAARLRGWALAALRSRRADEGDPLRKALWEVPLFAATDGSALSLAELDPDVKGAPELWRRLAPSPGRRAAAVWALSPLDAIFFTKRFPARRR